MTHHQAHSDSSEESIITNIPLVFHIIHANEPIGSIHTPSDQTIEEVVAYLNQAYSGTLVKHTYGNYNSANTRIQFTLAQRDPDCNPTNGINRINVYNELTQQEANQYKNYGIKSGNGYTSINSVEEYTIKDLGRWNNQSYYNIWIVNKINGTTEEVSGFTSFPGADAIRDGCVVISEFVTPGDKTLPHEIGHGMGLYHTFQDGCHYNPEVCALEGDRVCDTDPHASIPSCENPNEINVCTGNPWSEHILKNFMNYTSCADRFTEGQGERMRNSIFTLRQYLHYSNAGTPIDNNYVIQKPIPAHCTPTILTHYFPRIGVVKLFINNFEYKSLKYPESENLEYIDFTDETCHTKYLRPTLKIQKNETYEIFTEYYYGLGGHNQNIKIWIDYNNDGHFTEDEVFFQTTNMTDNILPADTLIRYYQGTSLPIPNHTVQDKLLRMRVVTEDKSLFNISSCGPMSYGKSMDFNAIIDTKLDIKEDFYSSNISIYPNPFDQEIHIESTVEFKGSIQLINLLGQEILSHNDVHIKPRGKHSISIANKILNQQVYYLVLIHENGNKTYKKVIKQ